MKRPAREKLWVVRPGDGATVAEIVARMGEDATRAVEEGRVFVGKRRVTSIATKVAPGDAVKLGAAQPKTTTTKAVLFVKGGVAATVKPAGIPTVPDHAGASHSFLAAVARELGRDAGKLHVTSRLDREVSGVVLFALDERAASHLGRAREEGTYARRYLAIAEEKSPLPDQGEWDAPIGDGKDPRHRAAKGANAKASRTRYRVVARATSGGRTFALLAVEPETGRTHQIRVHASHAGAPLFGDRDYGGETRITTSAGQVVSVARIALHAARVVVPMRGEQLVAEAPVPEELRTLWTGVGGAPEAWEKALA